MSSELQLAKVMYLHLHRDSSSHLCPPGPSWGAAITLFMPPDNQRVLFVKTGLPTLCCYPSSIFWNKRYIHLDWGVYSPSGHSTLVHVGHMWLERKSIETKISKKKVLNGTIRNVVLFSVTLMQKSATGGAKTRKSRYLRTSTSDLNFKILKTLFNANYPHKT